MGAVLKFQKARNSVQNIAVRNVEAALIQEGQALIDMATGTGKTHVAFKVISKLWTNTPAAPILWITHTNELVQQAYGKACMMFGQDKVGIYSSSQHDTVQPLIIASIQTFSKSNHLKKFSKSHFKYLFFDECHHAAAHTWKQPMDYFNKAKRFGFSASPDRPDSKSITDLFGAKVYELSFTGAQSRGLLAKDENHIILTNTVLQGAATKNGDYSKKQLDRIYASKERDQIIINSYKELAKKKLKGLGLTPKALCFCINVKHAKRMARLFNSAGIKAEFVCGNASLQSAQKRQDLVQRFHDTYDIEVMCSVDIFKEGIDVPTVNCALMARPTRSYIVYSQQIGRACRRIPNEKEHFIVLDYVDNVEREWQCYVMNNIVKRKTVSSQVVVEYLTIKDPVAVQKKVVGVMKGVEEFKSKAFIQWTFSECKKRFDMCKTRGELATRFPNAYQAARRNNWSEILSAHMSAMSETWNETKIQKFANKCTGRSQFRDRYPNAYAAAHRQGLINKVCRHMKVKFNTWTLAKCRKLTAGFKVREDFKKAHTQAYAAILRNGWKDIVFAKMPTVTKSRTREECRLLALKCKSREEFKKRFAGPYQAARKYGWIEDICSHITTMRNSNPWKFNEVHEIALTYDDRCKFKREQSKVYSAAIRNGWLKRVMSHMPKYKKSHISKAEARALALKCKSISEFATRHSNAYHFARKLGWKDIFSHLEPRMKWSESCILAAARKHKTRSEFAKKDPNAYSAAIRFHILDKVCSHMVRKVKS